jgi:WD40 repeat protein
VTFSPDGEIALTGGEDGAVRIWDVATGRPRDRALEHRNTVVAVAFSPNGKTILTGCQDFTARLWDAVTARPLGKPMEHQDTVYAVTFNPDGKTALTGSYDKTARLWSVPSPVEGDIDRIKLWVQVLTGVELDSQGDSRPLDSDVWHERRDRLEQLGGPPSS